MAIDQRSSPNETPMLPLDRQCKLKRIEAHTDAELDMAINVAISQFGRSGFFAMLHGIDAYMERRKRRDERRARANYVEEEADPWGNS